MIEFQDEIYICEHVNCYTLKVHTWKCLSKDII